MTRSLHRRTHPPVPRRMNRVLALQLAALASACLTAVPAQAEFVNLHFTADGMDRTAALWVPDGYDGSQSWPLVVFLHGGYARGDNEGDALDGWQDTLPLVRTIEKNPDRFPALVVFPRCPTGQSWMSHPEGEPGPRAFSGLASVQDAIPHIDGAMQKVLTEYSIDEDRISLTGKSIGGHGAFRFGALRADRFSAILPIAGIGARRDIPVLAPIPMWTFVGSADQVMPPSDLKSYVDEISEQGGKTRYTEIEGAGHGAEIEEAAYGNPEVIEWLLSQRRSSR